MDTVIDWGDGQITFVFGTPDSGDGSLCRAIMLTDLFQHGEDIEFRTFHGQF